MKLHVSSDEEITEARHGPRVTGTMSADDLVNFSTEKREASLQTCVLLDLIPRPLSPRDQRNLSFYFFYLDSGPSRTFRGKISRD